MKIKEAEKATAIVLDKTEIALSAGAKTLFLIIFSVVAFAVPFFLGHPQLLVGSIINAILILTALNLKKYYLVPIILLPSLAVAVRGMIFGSFTPFLVYLIPLIWVGNFVMVYGIKYLYLHKNINRRVSLGTSILAKVAVLYGAALLMIKLGIIPAIFAQSMGLFQIYTAFIGGVAAFAYMGLVKKIKL